MSSQILLFQQPRGAGSMLVRMFEKQKKLEHLSHPYASSRGMQLQWMQSEHFEDGMTPQAYADWEKEISKNNEKWRKLLAEAEDQEKILIVQSEPFFPMGPETILRWFKDGTIPVTNPDNYTKIPDDLLLHPNTIPIFTTRDPRLTIPSVYRTLGLMELPHAAGVLNSFTATSTVWNRLMYDFYISQGITPLVIDADDFITSPDFVKSLSKRLGLDREQLQFSWPAATEAEKKEMHPMYFASQRTLIESSGPISQLAAQNVDLAKEVEGWDAEFGDDAVMMRQLLKLAWPHHKYLLEKKMRVG